MSEFAIAAILAAAILAASTISVEVGVSVALIELALGVLVGNAFDLAVPDWLVFLGSFAGIVLTFLAGAEVHVPQLRREWRASVWIGAVSFAAPFFVCMAIAHWALGWSADAAKIAGIALSTTSLAVVYAVLVETGLNQTMIGKRIMSATFVTDLGTAAALSLLFITPNLWIVAFAAISAALIFGLPRLSPWFFGRYGNRVIEPEIKLVFAGLFLLMWLGDKAHSHAVLPAFGRLELGAGAAALAKAASNWPIRTAFASISGRLDAANQEVALGLSRHSREAYSQILRRHFVGHRSR